MTWGTQNNTKNIFKASAVTFALVATLGISRTSTQVAAETTNVFIESDINKYESATTTFPVVQKVEKNKVSNTDTKEIATGIDTRFKENTVSELLERNIKKLFIIRNMKDNWNGEGAKAFTGHLVDLVKNIVKDLEIQPEIFPTALDSIQLEYDGPNDTYLEIEISESNSASIYSIDKNSDEHYATVSASAEAINKLVNDFYAG